MAKPLFDDVHRGLQCRVRVTRYNDNDREHRLYTAYAQLPRTSVYSMDPESALPWHCREVTDDCSDAATATNALDELGDFGISYAHTDALGFDCTFAGTELRSEKDQVWTQLNQLIDNILREENQVKISSAQHKRAAVAHYAKKLHAAQRMRVWMGWECPPVSLYEVEKVAAAACGRCA